MMRIRRFTPTGVLLSLILALSSAAGATVSAQTQPTGTLTVLTQFGPQSLDTLQTWNSNTDIIAQAVYDTLVQYSPGNPTQLEPRVATEWTESDDGTEYVFTLRDDVTFHDGTPMTAADVKYTLDRVNTLDTGISYLIASYESSEVVSDTEIKVNLTANDPTFVPGLSRMYILNSKMVQANEGEDGGQAWLAVNAAGSGPYTLESYTPGEATVLEWFPDYWRGWEGDHVGTIVLRVIPEAATRLLLLKNGEADLSFAIALSELDGLDASPDFSVRKAETLLQFYIAFNTQHGPAQDVRVREALSYAYPYDTHVNQAMMGYVEAAQGPLSKPYACHKDDVTQPTYDLDKARQLLEDAGYDPSTMSLTMGFDPADEEMQKSVELFQSSLRELGIELVAVPLGFGPYVDALQSIETTPDVAATYIFGDVPDENNATFKHFHSSFIPGQGGFNWAHYSNPEVDALLEEAASSRDASARCELYKQLQEIIATDYVMINVSNGGRLTTIVQNAAVEGYEANMSHLQTLNVYDMSINR